MGTEKAQAFRVVDHCKTRLVRTRGSTASTKTYFAGQRDLLRCLPDSETAVLHQGTSLLLTTNVVTHLGLSEYFDTQGIT